jgi:AraC-like DNA-binding protein
LTLFARPFAELRDFSRSAERIGRALNAMHAAPDKAWTVKLLADVAAMPRSMFSDRFTAVVGLPRCSI